MRRKIYINGRFLTQKMTGVERFAYNACKTLHEMGIDFTLVCPRRPIDAAYDTEGFRIVNFGGGFSHFWEQVVLPLYFIGKKDYVVCSFTGLGSVLIRHKVMTIHDLSFLVNPKWFSRAYYLWYKTMTPLAARTSRRIITVSEFSKQEMLRFYPFLKADDIKVVFSAVDKSQFTPGDDTHAPGDYMLAVSSLDPRKNFPRLVEAFEGIEDCNLYIVGNANRVFGDQSPRSTSSDRVKYLGRVSDETLVDLYRHARGFIYPSIYEGFGLPPIEAMQCGCPVLVSDIPVLREVCGDAARYFDPLDTSAIRRAIVEFLHQPADAIARQREQGLSHCKHYSWRHTTQAIVEATEAD